MLAISHSTFPQQEQYYWWVIWGLLYLLYLCTINPLLSINISKCNFHKTTKWGWYMKESVHKLNCVRVDHFLIVNNGAIGARWVLSLLSVIHMVLNWLICCNCSGVKRNSAKLRHFHCFLPLKPKQGHTFSTYWQKNNILILSSWVPTQSLCWARPKSIV